MGHVTPGRKAGRNPISSKQKKGYGPRPKGTKQGKRPSKSAAKGMQAQSVAAIDRRLDLMRLAMQRMMTRTTGRAITPRPMRSSGGTTAGRITTSSFSECAAKYAIAIADPMNPKAIGACVPTGNSRPSFKVRTVLRGSFTVGTGGTGWLLYTPTVASDIPIAFTTDGNYTQAGDAMSIFTTSGGIVIGMATGSNYIRNGTAPFPQANFYAANAEFGTPTNVVGRIVSAGVSIQYAGSVMDMGGTMTSISRATHQSVLNGGGTSVPTVNTTGIQALSEARIARVSDQKVWVNDSARLDGEENFSGNVYYQQDASEQLDASSSLYPFSQGVLMTLGAAGGFSIFANQGVVANAFVVAGAKPGVVFNYEIVQHMEFQGLGAQYALSPSHQDAVGFAKVREAASAVPALAVEYPQASTPSLMKHALDMASEHLAPKALAAGGAMLRSALTGGGLAATLGAGASMLIA